MMITMKPLREILGENIAREIKDSEYSVRDIASKLEVSETTIHRWKSGDNPPDVNNLEALGRLLDIDPADFYKSALNVVPIYGGVPLKKYLILPDDIIEKLSHFGHDSHVWTKIRDTIDLQKQIDELSRAQPGKGSGSPESEK